MITIIGAGPAGCYTGHLLAKEGYDVDIYEEHKEIGKPVQCAGLLAEDINNLVRLNKDLISNRISRVRIKSQDNSELCFESKEIVLDRQTFDQHIANLALDSGCKIHLSSRFEKKRIKVQGKYLNLKYEMLIGGDGPFSRVAHSANLLKGRKYLVGMQVRAKIEQPIDEYQVHIGRFPGFGWIIPESDKISRIGLITDQTPNEHFRSFLKAVKPGRIIDSSSGLIPLYNPKLEIQKDNIYLIGDAAGQVKATTGGGIIPGLRAALDLTKSITKDLNYSSLFSKDVGRQLKLHLLMRNILSKFKSQDYSDLLRMLDKQSIKDLFKNISRERPSLLVPKLMLRQPKLLKYFKCLI